MPADPVAVVERQLAAYNAHDLGAFVACYAEDVRIWRPPTTEPVLEGRDALAQFYRTKRFCLPQLRAELATRIVLGDRVIDHERVHGLAEGKVTEVLAVFQVKVGLIADVWFF